MSLTDCMTMRRAAGFRPGRQRRPLYYRVTKKAKDRRGINPAGPLYCREGNSALKSSLSGTLYAVGKKTFILTPG